MAENLEKEVKQMLAQLTGLDVSEIGDTDDLIKDLGIDSLKVIEIATQLERTYKVTVKDSELAKLRKVNEAVEFLRELLARKKND